jgi:NADPH-dependent F420 reductase
MPLVATIGFIGGTGPEGKGLAYRFALAGHEIVIGSRSAGRAGAAAREVAEHAAGARVRGAENLEAARAADVIVLTVPYDAQRDTLPPLGEAATNKTVISTGVPMSFSGGSASMIDVPEGSAAGQAQALLPQARVAAAFQNLGAAKLWEAGAALDQDVIVCANDAGAKAEVMALAEALRGVRAVDGGPLANARYVEGITVLLVSINRRYKKTTGVRLVGL